MVRQQGRARWWSGQALGPVGRGVAGFLGGGGGVLVQQWGLPDAALWVQSLVGGTVTAVVLLTVFIIAATLTTERARHGDGDQSTPTAGEDAPTPDR